MWPFWGKLRMPSYVAPTTFVRGMRRIYIERRVRIFPGLRAEALGDGRIFFHDNVAVGQDFHITAMGDIHVGPGSLISGNVMVTDIDHSYEDVSTSLHDQPMRYSRTVIGANCFIGMGVRVQAGTELGEGCVVGANAVVRGKFPPHTVIVGVPAKAVKMRDPISGEWLRL